MPVPGTAASPRLRILGTGLSLPPARDVAAYSASLRVDVSGYSSWKRVCIAREEDHPSTLASAALGEALDRSGVQASDLRLVIYTGCSRDYLPSWSVSTEVMRLHGIGGACLGLDVTVGCVSTLCALDLVQGSLAMRGGGVAAVVAAERWSYTIDHTNPATSGLWCHGDSGGALVVGMNAGTGGVADFLGAEFSSASDNNGYVLIKYGGTRAPDAPEGENPHLRTVGDRPRDEVKAIYRNGYGTAYDALVKRTGIRGNRLITNQMSRPTAMMISEIVGVPRERAVSTGDETGHLGCVDSIVGLRRLEDAGLVDSPICVASSTAYAFGTGMLVPASAS